MANAVATQPFVTASFQREITTISVHLLLHLSSCDLRLARLMPRKDAGQLTRHVPRISCSRNWTVYALRMCLPGKDTFWRTTLLLQLRSIYVRARNLIQNRWIAPVAKCGTPNFSRSNVPIPSKLWKSLVDLEDCWMEQITGRQVQQKMDKDGWNFSLERWCTAQLLTRDDFRGRNWHRSYIFRQLVKN